MTKEKKWRKLGGGDFPPSFRFTEKGQQIEGKFIEVREVESDKFETGSAKFVTFDIESGTHGVKPGRVSMMGHGLLLSIIEDNDLQPGQDCRITYGGLESYKDGNKKRKGHLYTVEVAEA